MKEIKIVPVFNQEIAGVWTEWMDVRRAAWRYALKKFPDDVSDAHVLDMWKQNWANRHLYNFAFAAYDGDKLVGFLNGYKQKDVAYIANVFVLPEYQSHRIGTRLLAQAEIASCFGCKTMELTALATKQTKSFYAKYGFKPELPGSQVYRYKIRCFAQCNILPVFKPLPKLTRACSDIAESMNSVFDNRMIAKAHLPMFAYFDSAGNLQGYIVAPAPGVSPQACVLPHYGKTFITRMLYRAMDNFR